MKNVIYIIHIILVIWLIYLCLKIFRSDTKRGDNNQYSLNVTPGDYNYTWWKGSIARDKEFSNRYVSNRILINVESLEGDSIRNVTIQGNVVLFDIYVTSGHLQDKQIKMTTSTDTIILSFNTGSDYTVLDVEDSGISFADSDDHVIQDFNAVQYKSANPYIIDLGLTNADVRLEASISSGTLSFVDTNNISITFTSIGSQTLTYNVYDSMNRLLFSNTKSFVVYLFPLSSYVLSVPNLSVVFTYIIEFTTDASGSDITLSWPSGTVYAHSTMTKYQVDLSEALEDGQVVTITFTHNDSTVQTIDFTISVAGSVTPGIYPAVFNMTSSSYTSDMSNPNLVQNGTSYERTGTSTLYMRPVGWINNGQDITFYLYTSSGDLINYMWFRETSTGGVFAGQTDDDDLGMLLLTASSGSLWSLVHTQISNTDTYYLSSYTTNNEYHRRSKGVSLSTLFDATDMTNFPDEKLMVYKYSTVTYTNSADPANITGDFLFFPTARCQYRLVDSKSAIVPLLTNSITMSIDYPLFEETIATFATNVKEMVWSKGVVGYTTSTLHDDTNTTTINDESGRWFMTDGVDIHSNLSSYYYPVHGDMAMDTAGNRVVIYTTEDIKDDTKANLTYQPSSSGILATGFTRNTNIAVSYSSADSKCVIARWDSNLSSSSNVTLTAYDWTVSYASSGAGQGYVTLSNASSHVNSVQADTIVGSDDGNVFACNRSNIYNTFVSIISGTLSVDSSIPNGAMCGINGSYFWYLEDKTIYQTANFTTISDTDTVVATIDNLPTSASGWDAYYESSSSTARIILFDGTSITVYDGSEGLIYTKSTSLSVQKIRFTSIDSFYALTGTSEDYTMVTGRIV